MKEARFPKSNCSRLVASDPFFANRDRMGSLDCMIDRDAGPRGLFVPYFGKLASTHSGTSVIAVLQIVL